MELWIPDEEESQVSLHQEHAAAPLEKADHDRSPVSPPTASLSPPVPTDVHQAMPEDADIPASHESIPTVPRISLCLLRTSSLLWIVDDPQVEPTTRFVRDVFRAIGESPDDTPSKVPFMWPQPIPSRDQSDPVAIEALSSLVKLELPGEIILCSGTTAWSWLQRCPLPKTVHKIRTPDIRRLMIEPGAKRKLWLALYPFIRPIPGIR